MRAVTSFHKEGLEVYGRRFLKGFERYWPRDVELIVYAEKCSADVPKGPWKIVEPHWSDLDDFKRRCPPVHERPSDKWKHDAARFANKAWAIYRGLRDYGEKCFWLDSDIVTYRPIPMEFLEILLPDDAYCCYLGRDGSRLPYTETGFLGFNGAHEAHEAFMDDFLTVYESGRIFDLPEWHDCYAFDDVRKKWQARGLIALDLNTSGEVAHPFVHSILGDYMDHCKGPLRKRLGRSPEHPERGDNMIGVVHA